MMKDLTERKLVYLDDAIDALCDNCDNVQAVCPHYPCKQYTAIDALSPAQPDIIRCKDCDWWTKQEDSLQGRCDRYGMYPTGYWYCAGARERQKE